MLSSFVAQTEWTQQASTHPCCGATSDEETSQWNDGTLSSRRATETLYSTLVPKTVWNKSLKQKKILEKVQKCCRCTFRKVASLILLFGALGQEKISSSYTAGRRKLRMAGEINGMDVFKGLSGKWNDKYRHLITFKKEVCVWMKSSELNRNIYFHTKTRITWKIFFLYNNLKVSK